MLQSYSNTISPTARLFLAKSLFENKKNGILITDNYREIDVFANFSKNIGGHSWMYLQTLSDYYAALNQETGFFILHPELFEAGGHSEYLKKKSLYTLERNMQIREEECIEILLELGYHYSEFLSEGGGYKKEGGILKIRDSLKESVFFIEWFGDEIDAIIEETRDGKRVFLNKLQLKRIAILENVDRLSGTLNIEIVKELVGRDVLLIGLDFFPLRDTLTNILEKISNTVYFSGLHIRDTTALDIVEPDIAHIDVLGQILRETQETDRHIYTKSARSVTEYLEYNQITGVQIHEMGKNPFETVQIGPNAFFQTPLLIISDDTIGSLFVKKRSERSIAKNLDLLLSLTPGDLVVHREHGIARFEAIIKKNLGTIEREYIELHYAEGDKLFVPLTEIYRISKYVGSQGIELTRLSGKEWEKTLEKTDEEIAQIAQELIEIEAKRTLKKGIIFTSFREKEETFRKQFKYEHTPDQKNAIDEIFRDMESEEPMDRLLSGDVGFGKTEIAMNAIHKAVLSGYQVALISPLVVLADEHYETCTERFSDFGIRIGIITRMSTPREIKHILDKMASGTIDLVIGTHRLLGEDIHWKRLGLLIIDEEHKFGVSHKERIKKMRANIDILSLSATPIPRSLNLALSGIKKISLLTTPPKQKKPIETIVAAWNEAIIYQSIRHEIERGGQVILVANRIRGMESIKNEIEGIMGEIGEIPKIVITHGSLSGDEIEDRIHAFKKRQFDILLTTTIIENGVNFLSANTIIILDPEDFGLAQLHQLRGRVGRRQEQGYCYLLYRRGELSGDAKERIITIANNRHLGAGFEIAMRDMEIRGAGDVLGVRQAGKSKEVGLTLYFRMLEEKIDALKHKTETKKPVKIELDIPYHIQDEAFLSETDKLNFYREIESIDSIEELESIETSFSGTEDASRNNLFAMLRVRLILSEYGVKEIKKNGVSYIIDFYEKTPVERIRAFLDRFDKQNDMILLSVRKIKVETKLWKDSTAFMHWLASR